MAGAVSGLAFGAALLRARGELLQWLARVATSRYVPGDRHQDGNGLPMSLDNSVLLVVGGGVDEPLQVLSGLLHAGGHDLRTLFHIRSLQNYVRHCSEAYTIVVELPTAKL